MLLGDEDILYDYCTQLLGKPYVWGGNEIEFDCSGLLIEILNAAGEKLTDQTAHMLYKLYGNSVVRGASFGTIAFYGTVKKIKHCGFCLNSTLMIEAGGGGRKSTKENPKGMVRIRPIRTRKDLVVIVKPTYETWL